MGSRDVALVAGAALLLPGAVRAEDAKPGRRVPIRLDAVEGSAPKGAATAAVPHGWHLRHGIEGDSEKGVYGHDYDLPDRGLCGVTLKASALLRRDVPVARGGELHDGASTLPIVRTVRHPGRAPVWILGPASGLTGVVGSARREDPAPRRLRTSRRRVIELAFQVTTSLQRFGPPAADGSVRAVDPTGAQKRNCRRIGRRALDRFAVSTLESIRVGR